MAKLGKCVGVIVGNEARHFHSPVPAARFGFSLSPRLIVDFAPLGGELCGRGNNVESGPRLMAINADDLWSRTWTRSLP